MSARHRSILPAGMTLAFVVTACGSGPVAPPSSPSRPAQSVAPAEVMTAWVAPASLATVSSSELTLSATAPSTSIHQVSFWARASGDEQTLCVADAPGAGDIWSCTADLVGLGIPLGTVVVWFDTVNSLNTTSLDAGGRRSFTLATRPPRPVAKGFVVVKETTDASETTTIRFRATWSLPDGYASTIRVYGVTSCPRAAPQTNDEPCVLDDTTLLPTSLRLLAALPGDSRSTFITESSQGVGPGPYSAVVVQASNAFGSSPFGVLDSSPVCWQCVY
jgi:hypothetical protein